MPLNATGITAAGAALAFLIGWWMTRETIRPMEENPISRFVLWLYAGRLRLALRRKALMLSFPMMIFVVGLGAWIGLPTVLRPVENVVSFLGADLNALPGYVDLKHTFTGLETDDWIALDEGSWFYMPSLYPAASFSQAMEVLQTQDAMIKQIPEVENVLGKIGRIDSALDPAPAAMVETYVMLKPRDQWREGVNERDVWDEINAVATAVSAVPKFESALVTRTAETAVARGMRFFNRLQAHPEQPFSKRCLSTEQALGMPVSPSAVSERISITPNLERNRNENCHHTVHWSVAAGDGPLFSGRRRTRKRRRSGT